MSQPPQPPMSQQADSSNAEQAEQPTPDLDERVEALLSEIDQSCAELEARLDRADGKAAEDDPLDGSSAVHDVGQLLKDESEDDSESASADAMDDAEPIAAAMPGPDASLDADLDSQMAAELDVEMASAPSPPSEPASSDPDADNAGFDEPEAVEAATSETSEAEPAPQAAEADAAVATAEPEAQAETATEAEADQPAAEDKPPLAEALADAARVAEQSIEEIDAGLADLSDAMLQGEFESADGEIVDDPPQAPQPTVTQPTVTQPAAAQSESSTDESATDHDAEANADHATDDAAEANEAEQTSHAEAAQQARGVVERVIGKQAERLPSWVPGWLRPVVPIAAKTAGLLCAGLVVLGRMLSPYGAKALILASRPLDSRPDGERKWLGMLGLYGVVLAAVLWGWALLVREPTIKPADDVPQGLITTETPAE